MAGRDASRNAFRKCSSIKETIPRFRRFELVRIEATNPTFERIHDAIEIARCLKRLEKAEKSGNADALEALVDDKCDQVEELLGIAFVSAQMFISRTKTHL